LAKHAGLTASATQADGSIDSRFLDPNRSGCNVESSRNRTIENQKAVPCHDPESFARSGIRSLNPSIPEALRTKVIPVSFPPIHQRPISFSFVVGEPLRDFVEEHDKNVNSFHRERQNNFLFEAEGALPRKTATCAGGPEGEEGYRLLAITGEIVGPRTPTIFFF
jgi:hypothetical protein